MDILKSSQLVIFSHSTIFITFSYRSLAGFLFKLLRSSRRRKPEVALDFCVWPLCGGGAEDSWIWIIQQKVTSHPVQTGPRSSFSQSEEMAFRFAKIFFYLQPIRFVSFQTEGRKMLQAHSFDFETKTFGKRQHFIIVLKENNWERSVIEWRILHIAKLMLFRLLVVAIRDWVITLSETAHDVRNDLDEVLLAMVCIVYNGNIYNRSRFSLKVVVSELCIHVRVVEKTSWIVYSR